jgi:hypothetical protein
MEESRSERVPSHCADLDRLRDELNLLAHRVNRPASNESQGGNQDDRQEALMIHER